MKYIHLVIMVLAFVLCSCNNNDEPKNEINLPIIDSYLPMTVAVDIDDSESREIFRKWTDKDIVVNSLSELPDDPFGSSEAFKNINFDDYTLLITYNVHFWTIDTYRCRYFIDMEGAYNWAICIKSSDINVDVDNIKQLYFTRHAIVVQKLPPDKDVSIWYSVGSIGWDWGMRNSRRG